MVLMAGAAWGGGPTVPVAGAMTSSRAGVRDLVHQVSLEHGLDPKLVDALVRVESGYDPRAISRKGAMGLMQLMPATASRLGVADPLSVAASESLPVWSIAFVAISSSRLRRTTPVKERFLATAGFLHTTRPGTTFHKFSPSTPESHITCPAFIEPSGYG